MTWIGIVTAFAAHPAMRSSLSIYAHPLAGWPMFFHSLAALGGVLPAALEIRMLLRSDVSVDHGPAGLPLSFVSVPAGGEARALREAIANADFAVILDGSAPLISSSTIARLLRAAEAGPAALYGGDGGAPIAVAGSGTALAAAGDPSSPAGAARIAATTPDELLRVVDRHSLAAAAVAVRDRLVRGHEARGVTFMLPATCWLDADVQIGEDTLVYPGVVLEGDTEIGRECVVGPHSRIVDSAIGRGVELKGWNYVTRTTIRNHAVLEPYVRRGLD